MTVTKLLDKFFDETYTTPCWDEVVTMNPYVAIADDQVATDFEVWLVEHDIPFDRRDNLACHLWLFMVIDEVL